jgi:hypothetical protein
VSIDLAQLEAFLAGYFGRWIVSQTHTEDIVRQMSFGLIQVYPPSGEPSLTSQLNNIVFQIQSLREHLDAANTEMIEQNVDILAAIAALPDGSSPVTLPTTPPTGYGADGDTIADAVWHYDVSGGGPDAAAMVTDAGYLALNMGQAQVSFLVGEGLYYRVSGSWYDGRMAENGSHFPWFPLANILSDDTFTVFLERESGMTGWHSNGDGTWSVQEHYGVNFFTYTTAITDAEFLVLRDGVAAGAAALSAPVWPGIDNVTLSTPVALALGVTITEPMDGVIVTITGAPTKQGYFTFDDMLSYRNVGALAFIDDNGDAEFWQGLGFTSSVYCPKVMRQAAGVKVRTSADLVGTVTPWTITPV